MIRENELRIGNYLLLDNSKIVKLLWVKLNKACVIEVDKDYPSAIVDLDRLSGIVLNEEILLKCGFSAIKEFSVGKKYAYVVNDCYNDSVSFIVWYIDDKIVCNIPHVKYLHQLQNTVFALTNQELEINL